MSLAGTPTFDASPPPVRTQQMVRAPLVVVAVAVGAGIAIDRAQPASLDSSSGLVMGCAAWWLLAAACLACALPLHHRGRHHATAWLLLTSLAAIAGGWHHWCWNHFLADDVGRYATGESYPCCVEAIALAAPERMAAPPPSPFRAIPVGEKSQLPLRVVRVRNGAEWQPASGLCELMVDGHLLGVSRDDRLRVFGQIRAPSPRRNPGQFDFAAHMRADRQLCLLRSESPDCVEVIDRARGVNLRRAVDQLRAAWSGHLWNALGKERAPMAAAILLGARSAIPHEQTQTFRVTGALHVLVVSGLHAGILVAVIFVALGMGLLPDSVALSIAMLLLAGYAMLTGGHPPVIRATVLAEVACLAKLLRQNPFAFNSLAAAAIVVLLMNPADLFRTGPQLSFLCAGTLLWFSSVRWRQPPTPLEQLLHNAQPWYWQRARRLSTWIVLVMAATTAVWIVSLPLLMYQYHLITPIVVLASPLLFLAVVGALLSGFAFLILGSLVPPLAAWLAPVCDTAMGALDRIVEVSSVLPGGYAWTPGPAWWWVLGWYLLVVMILCRGGTTWGWRRSVTMGAAWILVGAVPAIARQHLPRPLEVTFLDVGHGLSVVCSTPAGTTLLYDAGSLGSPDHATETIAGFLWSRGIRKIDGLVLSHSDVDHFNAVPGLLDRFPIQRVFVSARMFPRRLRDDDRSAPATLKRLLDDHAVPIEVIQLGDRLTIDDTTHADVLYPDQFGNLGSNNANSLVIAIEHAGRRVLLTGDLESPGLDEVMADQPYDCHVLLAPHHGSRRSDPPGFAAWSTPDWVVISGSGFVASDQATATYRQSGAQVLLTRQAGSIAFTFQQREIGVATFLANWP